MLFLNRAKKGGGAFYSEGATGFFENDNFSGNVCSEGNGGAIRTIFSSIEIKGGFYSDNHVAMGNGGTLSFEMKSEIIVEKSTFFK
jgi:hypothetical protein